MIFNIYRLLFDAFFMDIFRWKWKNHVKTNCTALNGMASHRAWYLAKES